MKLAIKIFIFLFLVSTSLNAKDHLYYKIGIFGLTYKENISFLTNSPALRVIKKFSNHQFLLNDPVVKKINLKSKNFNFEKDIKIFFKNIKILLILTPWKWIKDEKN